METETAEKTEGLKAYARSVRADNAAFNRLPRALKRVMIAQDVLAQIRAQRLLASSGDWLLDPDSKFFEADTPLDQALKEIPQCNACALGAMFACTVQRKNVITVGEATGTDKVLMGWRGSIEDYLKGVFTRNQLALIEMAFERGEGGYDPDDYAGPLEHTEAAANFAPETFDSTKRMAHIMRNIIRNGGTFVPTQSPTPGDRRYAFDLMQALKRSYTMPADCTDGAAQA